MTDAAADPWTSRFAGLPLAVLHDHLDGGVRPQTLLELADEIGHPLPAGDATRLARWFTESANGGLPGYLATFEHIMPMLQTASALRRVAYEAVEDLAADGVVYAELRFAPEEHRVRRLPLEEAVEAVQDGIEAATRRVRTPAGEPIVVNTILCALRTDRYVEEVVQAAVRRRRQDDRLVGVDLAGQENGWPASPHAAALSAAREGQLHITIHAGEEGPVSSIADALAAGAERIGHGVAIAEQVPKDEAAPGHVLGAVATYLRDTQRCLELAVTSNMQTGAVSSIAGHPVARLLRSGFNVTLNTDNRLISGVSMSGELAAVADIHRLTTAEAHRMIRNAVRAGFGDERERNGIVKKIIDPAWEARIAAERD
ncbi:adenosine deaminase [Microbispora siamensis]|uniref:adenosine deaminase n=1 Tax=Microbispora siamensis TaxID=564413 RepID=A0ABQ4GRR2_9ACTN|nr:adenosine deaminase [Microbispora siamensis]GIH64119.1 adenosine deaminase 2 [Microbispora siamensis]